MDMHVLTNDLIPAMVSLFKGMPNLCTLHMVFMNINYSSVRCDHVVSSPCCSLALVGFYFYLFNLSHNHVEECIHEDFITKLCACCHLKVCFLFFLLINLEISFDFLDNIQV